MTAPLSKDELTRLSVQSSVQARQAAVRAQWIARLRAEGHRQCVGLHKGFDLRPSGMGAIVTVYKPARVCAMALLGEITCGGYWWRDRTIEVGMIGARAGLTLEQTDIIIAMNDGGEGYRRIHTFGEIADLIEAWFPSRAIGPAAATSPT